jgi:hypothetical protein
MTVHLPLLLLGIALLWFPRKWMRLGLIVGSRRQKSGRNTEGWSKPEPGDPRLRVRAEFTKGRNYFDLLRGAVGSLALVGGPLVDGGLAAATPNLTEARQVLAVQTAILFVGLLIQTIRIERRHLSFFAPIFFLAGISVTLCGPWGAFFAFALVWGVNPMFGGAQGFLGVYSLLLGGFGALLGHRGYALPIVAFGLAFAPVLLSLLTRRPLIVYTRKPSGHGG